MTCQRVQTTGKREAIHLEADEETKPLENVDSPQNEHTSEHQTPENNNWENEEKEHNAEKEDPTIDEYHSIKEKREDDDTEPRSVSENSHAKQLTNPQLHVEQEQRTSSTQPQLMLTKGKDPNIAA